MEVISALHVSLSKVRMRFIQDSSLRTFSQHCAWFLSKLYLPDLLIRWHASFQKYSPDGIWPLGLQDILIHAHPNSSEP